MTGETVKNGFRQGSGRGNVPYFNDLNVPITFSFAIAAGAANVSNVTITALDGSGATIAGVFSPLVFLSDAATGLGLTSTSASGTVTAKSASGADLGAITAKKALFLQTLATGIAILEITDTAKTGFYVCAVNPFTGSVHVSSQLVTASYG